VLLNIRKSPMMRLRRSSLIWRSVTLGVAWLWATGVVAFYFTYHFNQRRSPFLVVGGHTYFTNPPAQTLSQSDPVSARIVAGAVGITVLVGTLDLLVRVIRSMTGAGIAAISFGALLIAFSLFGLIRGLLGIGTVGLLVLLSGLPPKALEPEVGQEKRAEASDVISR
jgi:hypothetical protein